MTAPSIKTAPTAYDDSFARCITDGMSRTPKEIACKYFYDAEGSALFDAICALPEYYQTRTEVALLRRHAGEIAALIGAEAEILEFGAGALRKVRILLDALDCPRGYTPIDISGAYLRDVVRHLPSVQRELRAMVRAWEAGDAAGLARLMNEDNDDPHLREALLVDRNKAWARWIGARLARPGTVFVAVGAGHLAGSDSVQAQLAAMGIPAERVQ